MKIKEIKLDIIMFPFLISSDFNLILEPFFRSLFKNTLPPTIIQSSVIMTVSILYELLFFNNGAPVKTLTVVYGINFFKKGIFSMSNV